MILINQMTPGRSGMWRHRAPWGALAGPLGLSGVGAAAPAPWAVFGGMTCAVTGRREGEQGTIRSRSLAASWGGVDIYSRSRESGRGNEQGMASCSALPCACLCAAEPQHNCCEPLLAPACPPEAV